MIKNGLVAKSGVLTYNIDINTTTLDFVLHDAVTALGWDGVSVCNVVCTNNSTVGSSGTGPAFTVSGFPTGSVIDIINFGYIVGKGGRGGLWM